MCVSSVTIESLRYYLVHNKDKKYNKSAGIVQGGFANGLVRAANEDKTGNQATKQIPANGSSRCQGHVKNF